MTGVLTIVGLGPGDARHRTPAASEAIVEAEAVYGYSAYIDACDDLLRPGQSVVRGRMTEEKLRAEQAVIDAAGGRRVVLVSSGDAGVYGMATLALSNAYEIEETVRPEVRVLPGVTAALAASALVGAPLAHDFACLTLSDLLTPWAEVERRLRAIADADLAIALYNPRSKGRPWQLDRARQVLLERRQRATPVALVTDIARDGQRVELTTLADLDCDNVGMTTTVLVGSSTTRRFGDWLVTPRSADAANEVGHSTNGRSADRRTAGPPTTSGRSAHDPTADSPTTHDQGANDQGAAGQSTDGQSEDGRGANGPTADSPTTHGRDADDRDADGQSANRRSADDPTMDSRSVG